MKRKYDIAAKTVTWQFDDGLAAVTFHAEKASAANRAFAELFGFGSRVHDSAALSRKQKDGSVIDITETMRRDEVLRLVGHYESGAESWDMNRAPAQNPMILAMAQAANVDYATMAAKIGSEELAEFAKLAMSK